jgi:hypothetical protein
MVGRIISWIGSVASVIGLVATVWPKNQPFTAVLGFLIGIAVFSFGTMLFFDIRDYKRAFPRALKTSQEIGRYMFGWISKGGRVAIFTRDMSWAKDPQLRDLLLTKARHDELTVCLPSKIPLAEELERNGAHVLAYEELGYVPQSRFTIINKDRMDARVAVGRSLERGHVIEEFSAGDHPVFSVANDLVEIVHRLNTMRRRENETH